MDTKNPTFSQHRSVHFVKWVRICTTIKIKIWNSSISPTNSPVSLCGQPLPLPQPPSQLLIFLPPLQNSFFEIKMYCMLSFAIIPSLFCHPFSSESLFGYLLFQEDTSPVIWAMLPLEALRKDLFQDSLTVPGSSLALGSIIPIFTWCSPCVCVLFYKDFSQVGLGVCHTQLAASAMSLFPNKARF